MIKFVYVFLIASILLCSFFLVLLCGILVEQVENNNLVCTDSSYIVKNVKIAGSGINIMLATWEKHYPKHVERDGCDRCSIDDIPIEGSTHSDEKCILEPKSK